MLELTIIDNYSRHDSLKVGLAFIREQKALHIEPGISLTFVKIVLLWAVLFKQDTKLDFFPLGYTFER